MHPVRERQPDEKDPERVKATPLKGKPHKGNPPYPPLSGGYKKAMRPRRVVGFLFFLTPLTRGVGGGWFLRREGRPLYPLKRDIFDNPLKGGVIFTLVGLQEPSKGERFGPTRKGVFNNPVNTGFSRHPALQPLKEKQHVVRTRARRLDGAGALGKRARGRSTPRR